MASNIDETKPVALTPTTQSVRDNFAAAKAEILALQAQSGSFNIAIIGGTGDAITVTQSSPFLNYADHIGSRNIFTAPGTNTTGAPTMNIDGLGALPLVMGNGAPPPGDLVAGRQYWGYLESATSIRIAPFDSISVQGDTVQGNFFIDGGFFGKQSISAIVNAAGVTWTPAQMLSGLMSRDGPAANFSDTTPTAAELVAAVAPSIGGVGFMLETMNLTNRTLTLLAGAGVTLALNTTIAGGQNRSYFVRIDSVSPPLVTITGVRTSAR